MNLYIMKLVSFIVPAYNEEKNISNFVKEFESMWQVFHPENVDYEIVFVDDGSRDGTYKIALQENQKNPKVHILKLSRNFGKEAAVSAGFKYVKGDAAMVVDADLQYPIEDIPKFITAWENGYKHVVGLRNEKNTKDNIEKLGSKMFNKLINLLSEQKFNPKALDFRLVDRQIIDEFNKLQENQRIVRGLLDWLGFSPYYINYQEKSRVAGEASYSFKKRVNLAMNTILNHSTTPLKLISVLGVIIILISLIAGGFILADLINDRKLFGFSGTFIFANINLFMNGVLVTCLGLVSYYIGGIRTESIDRPVFIADEYK